MSLESFNRRIRAIAQDLPKNTSATASEAALRVLSVVVPATPVDTGRARGNWQTSIGSPIYNETTRVDKSGRAEIAAAAGRLRAKPPGATIYITNNVPYIGRLNDGYSAQAPAGFIERAIQTAIAGIRNARIVR